MITGFNTDIEHDGVVYHVQTEDKGLDTPIILSLVYAGGTILASKRSPYEDLIAEGFSDEVLAERLKRQHQSDLCGDPFRTNQRSQKDGRTPERARRPSQRVETVSEAPPEVETSAPATVEEPFEIEYWPMTQEWTPPPPAPPPEETLRPKSVEPEPQFELVEETSAGESVAERSCGARSWRDEDVLEDGLVIRLLDDEEFYSGQRYTLRVLDQQSM